MKTDSIALYFPYFMIVWAMFGLSTWLWIRSRPTADEKKLWHLRMTVSSGIVFALFVVFVLISWGQYFPLLIVLPFIVLITYLNLRFTFFCGSCGKMSHSQQWFSSTYHCPECGNKLR